MMSRKFTLLLSSIFAFGAASAPVQAEQLYRWESADGTVSFTDDAKRVPERYRSATEQIDTNALAGYGRYTPTDAAASQEYTKRLAERLDMLREANRAEGERAAPTERETVDAPRRIERATKPHYIERRRAYLQPDGTIRYRYSRNQDSSAGNVYDGPSLPVDPNDPSPVVTEQKQVRVPGQPITQTITVTRQGDRVLSVEKPGSNYHTLDFGEMSDYDN
jgi:hypothetical protein